MPAQHHLPRVALSLALLCAVAACGGGGDDAGTTTPTGTLKLSLTDAPACGYDSAHVTVEKVRVHRSSSAGDTDSGWVDLALASRQRIDLLSLNNGAMLALGQVQLPAGTYTQMRLVLAANTGANPLANAVTPSGGLETALTLPSGQESGLKMNVNLAVAAGQVAEFAIDFDACKSFVRAGNSGRYLLKPVLRLIPILSSAGQRVVGYVDLSLAVPGTTVSLQLNGEPVRATPPQANGRFVLYPVPAGTYDLVITASGRVNAVVTGVPVDHQASTSIGSEISSLDTPRSAASFTAAGVVTVLGAGSETGAAVRATQTLSGGPTIEVGYSAADASSGAYAIDLPAGAPARMAYTGDSIRFAFASDGPTAARYRLQATAPGRAPQQTDILLTTAVTTDFALVP